MVFMQDYIIKWDGSMFKKLEYFIEKKILGSKLNPLKSKRIIAIPLAIIFVILTSVFFFFALPDYVDCQGYFEPADFYKVYSQARGTVVDCKLTDGAIVKKDEVILQLDDTIERTELDALNKKIESLEKELSLLTQLYDNMTILYKEKTSLIAKSISNAQILYRKKSIPEMEYYERLNNLNYDLFSIETQYNNIIKQMKTKESDIKITTLEIQKKNIELSKKIIISPIDGKIVISSFYSEKYGDINLSSNKIYPGRTVGEGELLAYIAENDRYKAVALIPEKYIARINPGQESVLYLSTFTIVKGKITTGKLTDINNSAVKGTFLGFIELADESLQVIRKKTTASLIGTSAGIKIKTRKRTLYEKMFNLN